MTANPNKEILIDAYRPGADLVPKSGFPFRDDGKPHKGVDWSNGNSAGTPIYASMGGKVTHVGKAEGYGQWVIVEKENRVKSCIPTFRLLKPQIATILKLLYTNAIYISTRGMSDG